MLMQLLWKIHCQMKERVYVYKRSLNQDRTKLAAVFWSLNMSLQFRTKNTNIWSS